VSSIVQKLWGFCHVLRHDGVELRRLHRADHLPALYEDDRRARRGVAKGCSWPEREAQSGTALTDHYADALRTLGKQSGILGDIFAGSMPRFDNPVNLKRLITLIDETEWTALNKDLRAPRTSERCSSTETGIVFGIRSTRASTSCAFKSGSGTFIGTLVAC
jgi:type I restriction enzyme M protein